MTATKELIARLVYLDCPDYDDRHNETIITLAKAFGERIEALEKLAQMQFHLLATLGHPFNARQQCAFCKVWHDENHTDDCGWKLSMQKYDEVMRDRSHTP